MNKQQRIEKIEAELAKLKAECAEEQEWPQSGDEYWFYDCCEWEDDDVDQARLASGNCFRTKEEAEAKWKWLCDPRTQARYAVEQQPGFNPRGELCIEETNYGKIRVKTYGRFIEGGLRFTTKEQAQACIDLLGEEVIKCALGGE